MESRELEEVESVYGNFLENGCTGCMWEREGSCWYYMPDSKSNCNVRCSNYKLKSSQNIK